jgi:uncharacterized membrane protein YvbJ
MYEIKCPHCGRINLKGRKLCLICGKEIESIGKNQDEHSSYLNRVESFKKILLILVLAAAMLVMLKTDVINRLFH